MNQPLQLLLIAPPQATSSPALRCAIRMTETLGASLHIVAFVHSEALELAGKFDHSPHATARDHLMELYQLWLHGELALPRSKGLNVTHEVIWARMTSKRLVSCVNQQAADIVIKDLHDASPLKRMMLGCTEWELLQACKACVLFVKEEPVHTPLSVLAAVKFSTVEQEGRALREGIVEAVRRVAQGCTVSFHLLTACHDGALHTNVFRRAFHVAKALGIQDNRQRFEAFAQAYNVPKMHCHFVVGSPGRAILKHVARYRNDLLVIGAGTRAGKGLGSTARFILGQPPCSVLAVNVRAPFLAQQNPGSAQPGL